MTEPRTEARARLLARIEYLADGLRVDERLEIESDLRAYEVAIASEMDRLPRCEHGAIREPCVPCREAAAAHPGGEVLPPMPPAFPGETDEEYTDRLTGADGTGRAPYSERRFRQCSIGYHDECSDPRGGECECPCHAAVRARLTKGDSR